MTLRIHGIGTYLPPSRSIREMIREEGGDPSAWNSFDRVCVAGEQDHPSTMAAASLRAALDSAKLDVSQLKLVLSTSSSRDYPPSWAVSMEVMRLLKTPGTCMGFDILMGCLGTLVALDTARSWLQSQGGGYAAIVGAERWADSIDHKDPNAQSMWAASDGGTALVVGMGTDDRPAIAEYDGACYQCAPEFNNAVIIQHGGTRFPEFPEGAKPCSYRYQPGIEISQLSHTFIASYVKVYSALTKRFGAKPDWLVCNQVSKDNLKAIGQLMHVRGDRVCATGDSYGHIGPNDVVLGLKHLLDQDHLHGNIFAVTNTPYAWGAGLFRAP